uniref:Geranylgeranyl transferase type-2 subunit alpha n=1 Tax=Neobodo designis TaxID=312471 RepID=A0A7S1W754_NEODS
MHDQRKGTREELSAEQQTALERKIAEFKTLYAECYARRDAGSTSRDCLEPQQRLLTQNPECFSMWSHRRRVYLALWEEERIALAAAAAEAAEDEKEKSDNGAAFAATGGLPPQRFADLMAELMFNTAIIKRDYKCYAAWTHRRWILDHLSPKLRLKVLSEENGKLEELLRADERNFHAWGYRRWVVTQLEALGAYTAERDLAFAEAKIMQNFSNYSAWHNRAVVTDRLVRSLAHATAEERPARVDAVKAALDKDVDMIVRAFYCDPNDQSAWMYVPALLAHLAALGAAAEEHQSLRAEVVGKLLDAAYELAEDDMAEADAAVKWPLWLIVTLAADGHVDLAERPLRLRSSDEASELVGSLRDGWKLLGRVDPLRKGFFFERARLAKA